GDASGERGPPRNKIGVGRHGDIEGVADAVADREWRQKRQNQIWARAGSPDTKRLPCVFVSLLDAKRIFRDIKKSSDSDGAVDREAREFRRCASKLQLQTIIDDPAYNGKIVKKIVHAPLHRIGQHEVPASGNGPQNVAIEHLSVEPEHFFVEALKGIIFEIFASS